MKFFIIIAILFFSQTVQAQQKWNLQTIVAHAMANNLNVKLADVQAKQAALNAKQSKQGLLPNLSFSTNVGLNSGNNQDPTTFNRITQTYLAAGLQLQSSADIFNFYSKKNTLAANVFEAQAAIAATDKVKNDIALTAANAYLQILLSKEQENITAVQIQQTQAQLTNTRKLVNAGALPELNATQLDAQLTLDSVNYITAKGNTTLALLNLKSYMNIDAAEPFEVETPAIENIPVEPIANLQPDYVYDVALKNLPQQRYNSLKMKAAEKNAAAAKAATLPTFGAYGSLGSSYINARTPAYSPVLGSFVPNGQKVTVNGTDYLVTAPQVSLVQNGYNKTGPFGSQLSDNFKQSVGVSISVPILSGGALRANASRSKLNINTIAIQQDLDNQKLKQDIYQAYNAALIALQKYNASNKSININELNVNYANKRFGVGMLSTFDLITTQNNLLRARLEFAQNRYDYVFKMKVLEFYKGMGLKL